MEPVEGTMSERSSSVSISTKQDRIAMLAKQMPDKALTSLSHHIDIEWLKEAYRRTRKDGAAGVDGQTAAEYEEHLEANLQSLLDRAKSGTYRAPPVRRVHIPKGTRTGETRPIGVPTLEDKVLQRAVVMVLEPIYERDFLPCSYGFRPERSAHQALAALREQLMAWRGGWVIELDIQRFFDSLDRARLREMLHQRVGDGVILRLIGKWLNAGVMEAGVVMYPAEGTPQGGVISPLLANIYLHEVLDAWFETMVKPVLKGPAFAVRYADDAVLGFLREDDARRVLAVLPKRFGKYRLALHPEKTGLLDFRRPPFREKGAPKDDSKPPRSGPRSFDFLGFTHFWGHSRKGHWAIKVKTAKDRLNRAVRSVALWCRKSRHTPVAEQWQALCRKVLGHTAYYGLTGNSPSLRQYRAEVVRAWWKWLNRRSQRRSLTGEQFLRLLRRYPLPPARPIHSLLCPANP